MAGMIQGMFPELFPDPEKELQQEAARRTQFLQAGLAGMLGQAGANFQQNLLPNLGKLTGRDVRTGEQKFREEAGKLNPQAPNYYDAMLALAQHYIPEQVPNLKPRIEELKRAQAAEQRAQNAETRAQENQQLQRDRFALEQDRVEQSITDSNRNYELNLQRLGLSQREIVIAEQRAREATQTHTAQMINFSNQMADRDLVENGREAMAEQLRAKGQDFLAEAMENGMTVGEAARLSTQMDIAKARELAAAAASGMDPTREKPMDKEIEGFVEAAYGQIKKDVDDDFNWITRDANKALHIKQILRSFFAGGGYQIIDPVEQLELAKQFVRRGRGLDATETVEEPTPQQTEPSGSVNPLLTPDVMQYRPL